MKILILNGVNLSRLGKREPHLYGSKTLGEIEREIRATYSEISFEFFQSDFEGALIEKLYEVEDNGSFHGVVLNAGAFTHTSIALRDAIASIRLPVVEIHLTNIFAREVFRRTSVISEVCIGVISGFGDKSYHLGVQALCYQIQSFSNS